MNSTLLRLLALVCALPALAQEQKLDSELLQAGETDERVRVQILLANPPHPEVMGRIRRSAQARVEAASAALKRLDVTRASRQDYEAASRQVDAIELEIRRQGTAEIVARLQPAMDRVEADIAMLGGVEVQRWPVLAVMQADVPRRALRLLAASSDVGRIDAIRPLHLMLDKSVPQLGAPSWWNDPGSYTGTGQSVAVVDTGITTNHPGFNGLNIVAKVSGANASKSTCFNDSLTNTNDFGTGHGTHVSGIIASRGSKDYENYKGVAPGLLQLFFYKVFFTAKATTPLTATCGSELINLADVNDAMTDIVTKTAARIANISLGGPSSGYPSDAAVIDNLMDTYNAVFVIAAGNLSTLKASNPILYPATATACTVLNYARAYNGLSVARADSRGVTNADSCRDIEGGRKKPDLAAPGSLIFSTSWNWQEKDKSVLLGMSGTSQAAPHIAGALALLAQAGVTDSRAARALLINTASSSDSRSPDGYESGPGFGYADLTAALAQRGNGITGSIRSEETQYWVGPGPGLLVATLTWNKHSSTDLSALDLYAYDVRTGDLRKSDVSTGNNVKRLLTASTTDILLRLTAQKFSYGQPEPFALALSGGGFRSIAAPELRISCTDPAQTSERNSILRVDCSVENPSGVAVPNVSIQLAATAPAGFEGNSVFLSRLDAGQKGAYPVTIFIRDTAGEVTLPIEITTKAFGGLKAQAVVKVTVGGRKVRLLTDPPNLSLNVDGQLVQTPYVAQWVEGSRHKLEAVSRTSGGTRNVFAHWTDGWPLPEYTFDVPTSDAEFTATFRNQYQLTVRGEPSTVPVGTMALSTPQPSTDGFYDAGAVVLAYATIASGQEVSWTGDYKPTGAPEQVEITMDGPKTIVARVGVPVRVLSLRQGGRVEIDGVAYATPATVIRAPGQAVSLTPLDSADSDRRFRFVDWEDGVAGARTLVTPAEGATLLMNYRMQYRLTIGIPAQEARLGEVVASIPSADGFYDLGTRVVLDARAITGSAFIGWTGDASGQQNPLEISVDRPLNLTARFALPLSTVIDTVPSGQPVFVDGERRLTPFTTEWATGSRHTVQIGIVQISDNERFTFDSWSDGGAANHTVTAGPQTALLVGTYKRQFMIASNVLPQQGPGARITLTPFQAWFDAGSAVEVSLVDANDGWAFQSWSGALTGTARQQSLVVDGPKSVVAIFAIPVVFQSEPAGRQVIVDGASYVTPKSLAWPDLGFHSADVPPIQNGPGGLRYVFREWVNAGTSPSRPVTATPGLPTQIARFDVQVPLQLSGAGQGSSVVADSPGDSGYYNLGTEVRISAGTSLPGLAFVRFEGDVDGGVAQQSSLAVRMDKPRAIRAVFRQNVQFTSNAPGSQVVVDGQAYPTPYLTAWEVGSRHQVGIQHPSTPSATRLGFAAWSDGGAISHEVIATAGVMHYIATFVTQYRLEAAAAPSILGALTLSPPSPDGFYAAGTKVQIAAQALGAGSLAGWSGDFTPTAQGIEVVMSAPRTIVANFDLGVTIGTDPGEGVFLVDNVTYRGTRLFRWQLGSTHTIAVPVQPLFGTTQIPVEGTRLEFLGWSDNGAVSHGVVAAATTTLYRANFLRRHQLSLAPPLGGTVRVTPESADGYYNDRTEVQLEAASGDLPFQAWHGDRNDNTNPINLSMTGSKRIVATFGTPAPPQILALLTPETGTALRTQSAGFSWLAVPGATSYSLTIGSQPDRNDIFDRTTTGTSIVVPQLPCDARLMWVRLNARIGGTWMEQRPYIFQAAESCAAGVPAGENSSLAP